MNLLAQTIAEAARRLEAAGVPSSRLDAEVLMAHSLGLQRLDLYKLPEKPLTAEQEKTVDALIRRRLEGVPVAYLRGKKEFYSLEFEVGPGVLIPRAETEILVDEALRCLAPLKTPKILELGTGSGAILIAILTRHPNASGIATDISAAALTYAKKNAAKHQVADRIAFLQGDLFEPVNKIASPSARNDTGLSLRGSVATEAICFSLEILRYAQNDKKGLEHGTDFDLIVSNPPYIPSGEISPLLRFEPREALDGGPDGLMYYRKILQEASNYLKTGGRLLLEIGIPDHPECFEEVIKLFKRQYQLEGFKKDLGGHLRACILRKN